MSGRWRGAWLGAALLAACGTRAEQATAPRADAGGAETGTITPTDGGDTLPDGGALPDGSLLDGSEPPPGNGLLVAYYEDWAATKFPVTSIDWTSLTHVAEAFALPQPDGGGLINEATIANDALVQAAHAHGAKVVISVGGSRGVFSGAVTDPKARATTVAAIAALCRDHAYDGVDIDWEYPETTTVASWVALVDDLRAALDAVRPGLSVSTTISPWPPESDILPVATLAKLSWVSALTYLYYGASSATVGFFAPLDAEAGAPNGSVSESIAHLVTDRGVPASKLLLGLGFYGIEFKDGPPGAKISSPSNVSVLSQQAIAALLGTAGWVLTWDATANEPSLVNGKTFVTYENAASIDAKCAFAHSLELGGAMVWQLGAGQLSDGSQPLLAHAAGCR